MMGTFYELCKKNILYYHELLNGKLKVIQSNLRHYKNFCVTVFFHSFDTLFYRNLAIVISTCKDSTFLKILALKY